MSKWLPIFKFKNKLYVHINNITSKLEKQIPQNNLEYLEFKLKFKIVARFF